MPFDTTKTPLHYSSTDASDLTALNSSLHVRSAPPHHQPSLSPTSISPTFELKFLLDDKVSGGEGEASQKNMNSSLSAATSTAATDPSNSIVYYTFPKNHHNNQHRKSLPATSVVTASANFTLSSFYKSNITTPTRRGLDISISSDSSGRRKHSSPLPLPPPPISNITGPLYSPPSSSISLYTPPLSTYKTQDHHQRNNTSRHHGLYIASNVTPRQSNPSSSREWPDNKNETPFIPHAHHDYVDSNTNYAHPHTATFTSTPSHLDSSTTSSNNYSSSTPTITTRRRSSFPSSSSIRSHRSQPYPSLMMDSGVGRYEDVTPIFPTTTTTTTASSTAAAPTIIRLRVNTLASSVKTESQKEGEVSFTSPSSTTVIGATPTSTNSSPSSSLKSPKTPKKCKFCPRAFSCQSHLARHERSHTGERPFACPSKGCNQTFTRLDNMSQHYRIYCTHNETSASSLREKYGDNVILLPMDALSKPSPQSPTSTDTLQS